ncbi:MAG: alpha/beta hydrolase fold [Myxococcaceae bacterium]|nr:alpha/beta hydrolase fold [Myxococcaceae bacterium]
MTPDTLANPRELSVRAQLSAAPVRMIDIGTSRLSYRRLGSGPDLVFVHGWPLDSNTFRALLPELVGDFTCHLIDLPGAGASVTSSPAALQLSAHATSLRAAIDALGLTSYALLAHDSGGFVARVVASEDPRVTALVLGNTELPSLVATVVRVLHFITRLPFGRSVLLSSMRLRAVRRSPLAFGGCFHDLDQIDGEFHELFVRPLLSSKQHAIETLELVRTVDETLFDQLPAIHARIVAPTLLIWGADDPIFPLAGARTMLSQFAGGATLEVIAKAKAFVHEERPELFSAHARAFLLRCCAVAGACAPAADLT